MEVKKRRLVLLFLVVICVFFLLGCGKKYDEYDKIWISEDGKVSLKPNGEATINYEKIDDNWEIEALSDSGRTQLYFEYKDSNAVDNSNLIWIANATIKNNKLYLEIKEDKYTGLEGKTIVLEQSKE